MNYTDKIRGDGENIENNFCLIIFIFINIPIKITDSYVFLRAEIKYYVNLLCYVYVY